GTPIAIPREWPDRRSAAEHRAEASNPFDDVGNRETSEAEPQRCLISASRHEYVAGTERDVVPCRRRDHVAGAHAVGERGPDAVAARWDVEGEARTPGAKRLREGIAPRAELAPEADQVTVEEAFANEPAHD